MRKLATGSRLARCTSVGCSGGGEHDDGIMPCQKQPLVRFQKLEADHDGQVNVEENQAPVVERQSSANATARSNQQGGVIFSAKPWRRPATLI